MKPVVTVAEMRKIDTQASVTEVTLIERAGWAVARKAKTMLGGTYGRRVVVIAGKGNNGADGRVAGKYLSDAGASVVVRNVGEALPGGRIDLVIDAAFGTGFHGDYEAPDANGVAVLGVDIPSGVDGDTGVAVAGAVRADATITFAALKPGHLLGDGPELCGDIEVADIGLDCASAGMHLLEEDDLRKALPEAKLDAHKWQTAVAVIAGSPGMLGAPSFAVRSAQRSGAGMVRLGSPGVPPADLPVGEAVAASLPEIDWADSALELCERVKAVVLGPGLGRSQSTIDSVRNFLSRLDLPVVIDADALFALGAEGGTDFIRKRQAAAILTPHDGEFARLFGRKPGISRIDDVKELAQQTNSTVLLKGSTTIVASPDGRVILTNTGSARLATAGTGDVLSGVVAAFVAQGLAPAMAAACGAYVHGAAAESGYGRGLLAGDLPELIAGWLSERIGAQ